MSKLVVVFLSFLENKHYLLLISFSISSAFFLLLLNNYLNTINTKLNMPASSDQPKVSSYWKISSEILPKNKNQISTIPTNIHN